MFRMRFPSLWLAIMLAGACSLGTASAAQWHHHHPRLESLEIAPEKVVGGSAMEVTGTVTLKDAAPTGGVVVTLSSSDTHAATVPATVTVLAGDKTATFTILAMQVNHEMKSRIRAELSEGDGDHDRDDHRKDRREDTLTVLPFKVESFSFNPSTIKGGTAFTGFQQTIGTITLSAPAGSSGVVVTMTSSGPGTSLPTTVTIPAGATSVNFSMVAGTVATTTVYQITATIGSSSVTTSLTVTP